ETGAVRLSVAVGCPYMREADLGHEPCAMLAMQALKQRTLQWVHGGELKALKDVKPRELCQEKQAIAVPIMASNHVFGVLAVFEREDRRSFHRNEVGFVVNVAAKLALVIQNTQAYLTINRLNESLEEKVRDRTAQLEQAITTLKETQAQLMQTEKLATVGTLAGGVAHELNNPLAAVLANVQLLLLDAEDADTRESLALIEAGAQRCKAIVSNLLNFSRQATPEQRSLSINRVVRESIDLLQHRIKLVQGTLALDLAEMPPVIGNATELGQIVTNLLVNALDAIAEVDAPRHVSVRSAVDGQQIVVEVRDNGPGIDPLTLPKIFDPFFTTKPVGKGTGLGLSVCQQIAGAHGGRIEVESTPGKGSLFRLRLPAAHGAIAKVEA
ncbi:MAG TPA: ATP-binding protein, partial [Oscillatoriaceae cyanobacterium]